MLSYIYAMYFSFHLHMNINSPGTYWIAIMHFYLLYIILIDILYSVTELYFQIMETFPAFPSIEVRSGYKSMTLPSTNRHTQQESHYIAYYMTMIANHQPTTGMTKSLHVFQFYAGLSLTKKTLSHLFASSFLSYLLAKVLE